MKKILKSLSNKKVFSIVLLFLGMLGAKAVFAEGWDPTTLDEFGLPESSIYEILRNILNWLLAIFGIVGIIGFAISGIMYLVSAGDETQMGTAKNAMKYSIIGVIVGLSGLVVIWAVDFMLNGWFF